MSEFADDINLRAQIMRIDRDMAETRKLLHEADTFREERMKFYQESRKLDAEHDKLRRDSVLAPWLLGASLFASLFGGLVVALLTHFWKA
ncbi:MAG: hypothetical protein ABSA58_17935 [Acetobacteraceae bacterium]|jgi:hypothetical protein